MAKNNQSDEDEDLMEMSSIPYNTMSRSMSASDNISWIPDLQTVRRTRSLHRTHPRLTAISKLPSRNINTLYNSGAAKDKLKIENIALLSCNNSNESPEVKVMQIVEQMENNDDLMEDTPDGEEMRIDALRELPQCLTVKRNIRAKITASVSRKSKKRPITFWKRSKYRIGFWWKNMRRHLQSILFTLEFWYDSIKSIEGHFGSGVSTYFHFLRWLFVMNMLISIFMISFIVIPQAIYDHSTNNVENIQASFHFFDIFTGQGSFTNSTLYYGYYNNKVFSASDGHYYNIPLAYILTMMIFYLTAIITLGISVATSYRKCFIETSGGLKDVYAQKIFCGWDFSIATQHAAALKSRSIYNELKELLGENYKSSINRSFNQKSKLICIKVLVNTLVLGLLSLTGFIMWLLMDKTDSYASDLVASIRDSNNKSVITAVIVSTIMTILPLLFGYIVKFEQYGNPRTSLFITLGRTFALECVVVSILCIFWLKSDETCWETLLGQETYRLIIFDFLFSFFVIPLFEIVRILVYKYIFKKSILPEFNIAGNTLMLIYNQTLIWMGLFYSPLLTTIMTLKFAILFYVKKAFIMKVCQPSIKSWRATQTRTLFHGLTFISLMLVTIALGYTFARVKTGGCGPFKGYDYVYLAIFEGIFNIKEGNTFFKIIMFLFKPGVVAFILISMCVAVYYLRSKSIAQKGMVSILRQMLVMESKDKEFLLDAIAKVAEGAWVYNEKKSNDTYFETSGTWKYQKTPEKNHVPSNAGFQFEMVNTPHKSVIKRFNRDSSVTPSTSGIQ